MGVHYAGTISSNIRVRVGDNRPPGTPLADGGDWNGFFSGNAVCATTSFANIFPNGPTVLACAAPLVGQYVSLQLLQNTSSLQVCEVQVFGGE